MKKEKEEDILFSAYKLVKLLGLNDEDLFVLNNLVTECDAMLFGNVKTRFVREINELEHFNSVNRKRHLSSIREILLRQLSYVENSDKSDYSEAEIKANKILCDKARSLLCQINNKIRAIEDLSYLRNAKAGRKKADREIKIDSLKADERVIEEIKRLATMAHKKGNTYWFSNLVCAIKMKGSELCSNSKKEIAIAIKNYLKDDKLNVETMCSKHNIDEHKIANLHTQISKKLKKTDK